jgi:hypothetical protein
MAGGGAAGQGSTSQNGIGNMTGAKIPQWMQGLQLGQQIAQMGQSKAPQAAGFQPHPMSNIGGPAGMPQGGVVPGAQGAAPPMPSQNPMPQAPGLSNTGQQPAGQVSPQMLQMLMQMRQQGGGGLMGR